MEGKVPIPLTQEEYERLLLTFGYGDEALTASSNRSRYELDPEQDELQEKLRAKVYRPVIAQKFPTVILNVDDEDDFMFFANTFYKQDPSHEADGWPKDEYLRDSTWTTWGLMKLWLKAHPLTRLRNTDDPPTFDPETDPDLVDEEGNSLEPANNHWRDRLIDTTVEDYPDDTPCQVLFGRKILYFGSLTFVDDTLEALDPNLPLGNVLTAIDAADFDPRVNNAIIAGALREDDGGLNFTFPRSAVQPWIDEGPYGAGDPPGGTPGGGVPGGGDPRDPGGDPYPPDGRPGSGQPPESGGGGGGGHGYPPSAPSPTEGGRVELNCAENIVFSATGTNGSETFASFLGVSIPGWLGPLLGLIPLPDVYKQEYHQDIYASVVAAIAASGELPTNATITRVALCFHWIATIYYGISAFGLESFISKRADVPKLIAHRTDASPLTTYTLKNDETYKMVDFVLGIDGTPVELAFSWRVGEATPDQHLVISKWNTVDTLTLNSKLYAAFSNFFGALPTSPILEIGVEGFDYLLEVTAWTAHFDLNTIAANLHDNPNNPGETLWFSDSPDGLTNGRATGNLTPKILPNPNNVSGTTDKIVLLQNGIGFAIEELFLIGSATGYVANADKAYTTCRLKMKYAIGGACTLHVRSSAGGDGFFTTNFTLPTTSFNSSAPNPTNQLEEHEVVIDISGAGITVGMTLFAVSLTTSSGVFFNSWRITLS